MTLDRTAILRNAQKLLRIGKLGPAIKLYEQVVRETPDDLQTAAKLGNLYVRAGSPEKAMNLFLGIADGLRIRGLHSQASVAYQRVLAVADDNEQALLQLAERQFQRPDSLRLELFDNQLVLSASFVKLHGSGRDDLHPVTKIEPNTLSRTAPHHGLQLRGIIFEREVQMP